MTTKTIKELKRGEWFTIKPLNTRQKSKFIFAANMIAKASVIYAVAFGILANIELTKAIR